MELPNTRASAEFSPAAGAPPLASDAFASIAREFLLAEAVAERLSRVVDPAVLQAMLNGIKVDLSTETAAERSSRTLAEAIGDPDLVIEPRYDATTESRRLVIVRTRHGIPHTTRVDSDLLEGGDGAQIAAAAALLVGLVRPGATIKRGEKSRQAASFKEALDWLLAEARSAVAIQRYKGLGEMNPGQLWETTMDPSVRRLLKVQIEDTIASDEIFDKLMGEQVEPRRAFIESNALGVRNLDV